LLNFVQVATVFALFYLCALLLAAPYKERTYDQLDMLMTAQLLLCCQASSWNGASFSALSTSSASSSMGSSASALSDGGAPDSAFYTLYQSVYGATLIAMCCVSGTRVQCRWPVESSHQTAMPVQYVFQSNIWIFLPKSSSRA
jgi:hypothetical protein